MSLTKTQILTRVAANVNGDATAPDGDELSLFSEYLEESNQEWAAAYDPQVLLKPYYTTMGISQYSGALPTDFKEKFAGYIIINGAKYQEIKPQEAVFRSDQCLWWGGNQDTGYYFNLNYALTTGASLYMPYHSRPTSLATGTAISPCPDPHFLVNRTSEKVLLQRGQPEYQEFQLKADLLLQRMVQADVTADIQRDNTIKDVMYYNGFTLGED